MTTKTHVVDRILAKCTESADGCWIFNGSRNPVGYGRINRGVHEGVALTHRVMFESFRTEIPKELVLDHLCRVTSCCNPWHVEPVSQAVNIRRSPLIGKTRPLPTHCPEMHPYVGANIYRNAKGHTSCRKCMTQEFRDIRAARKAS